MQDHLRFTWKCKTLPLISKMHLNVHWLSLYKLFTGLVWFGYFFTFLCTEWKYCDPKKNPIFFMNLHVADYLTESKKAFLDFIILFSVCAALSNLATFPTAKGPWPPLNRSTYNLCQKISVSPRLQGKKRTSAGTQIVSRPSCHVATTYVTVCVRLWTEHDNSKTPGSRRMAFSIRLLNQKCRPN